MLCAGFLCSWQKRGLHFAAVHELLISGASHRGGWLQGLWCRGSVSLWHVGSSGTRNQTGVPCVVRQPLNPWATREAPLLWILLLSLPNLSQEVACLQTQLHPHRSVPAAFSTFLASTSPSVKLGPITATLQSGVGILWVHRCFQLDRSPANSGPLWLPVSPRDGPDSISCSPNTLLLPHQESEPASPPLERWWASDSMWPT